jgi:NAD(P)-dependent dehydrogenase (short-subunit alcohol dehydrogenase family)
MLAGKIIIITGASSGIGKSIAIHLSGLGVKCILIGRSLKRLKEVQALCSNETMIVSEDLTQFNKYEEIYGFVHSAGIEQTILLQQLTIDNLKNIFDINVFSAIEFIRIITKKKYKEHNQSIVLISSVMGVVGNKGLTSYSASKGAIISMIKSMALELSNKNSRVNAVSPGHIHDSEMSKIKESKLSNESNERIKNNHPLGLGSCNDIAFAVQFLLSDESKWITGQNIIIDGGYSIQ